MRSILIIAALLGLNLSNGRAQKIDTNKVKSSFSDTLGYDKNARPVKRIDTLERFPNVESQSKIAGREVAGDVQSFKTPFSVDGSGNGASVVNIPIEVPAGVNGFAPTLALAYNSQAGNGTAGWGWNIAGLSVISRIPTTKFHDDRIDPITNTPNDRYALDGQRLLLKSGTYGGNGAEYQTEHHTNLRIFSWGSGASGAGYFEVRYPDGSKAFYGMDAGSISSTGWALKYWENSLGARITYTYQSTGNTFKPIVINYGSIYPNAELHSIYFEYGVGSRIEQSFSAGEQVYRQGYLSRIVVKTLNTDVRSYQLSFSNQDLLGYRSLTSVQEFNPWDTEGKEAVWITYAGQYPWGTASSTIPNLGLTNVSSTNSEAIFTNLTGRGGLDFLLVPTAKDKYWGFLNAEVNGVYNPAHPVYTGTFQELFPVSWLNSSGKLVGGQGAAVVKNLYGSYKFEVISHNFLPFQLQYDRMWNDLPKGYGYYSECDNQFHEGEGLPQEFISGDFNGDGLTDIMAISRPVSQMIIGQRWVEPNPWNSPLNPWDPQPPYTGIDETGCVTDYADYNYSHVNFINLDRRITTGFVSAVGAMNQPYRFGDKLFTADFNGDGKTDILHVTYGNLYVYSLNNNNYLDLLWHTSDASVIVNQLIMLGDYNGDGKMDVMLSTPNETQYATFISKGNGFIKQSFTYSFASGSGGAEGSNGQYRRYLIPTDINGDGKTDMVVVRATTYDGSANGFINCFVYDNTNSSTDGMPNFVLGHQLTGLWTNLKHNAIPVSFRPGTINNSFEVGFLSDNTLTTYKILGNKTEHAVSSVYQNGLGYDFAYDILAPYATSHSGAINFYTTQNAQVYPRTDIEFAPNFRALSKLTKHEMANTTYQIFGYADAVSSIDGLGFLGFGKVIRSNWHVNDSDVNRMFDITYRDPLLRGAVTNSFRQKGSFVDPTILSSPLISDGAGPANYIGRSQLSYQTELLPNKVFVNKVITSSSRDMLTGVVNVTTNEYDNYYNIIKETKNINNTATEVQETTYDNNPSGYYVGRPLTKNVTKTLGSDTYSTDEEYSYNGFLLTQIKKRGHGTPWQTETMEYDLFGNVTKKIMANNTGTRETSTIYDVTGRFPLSQKDVEGLITTATFDAVTGDMNGRTNAYGVHTFFGQDYWGRIVFVNDNDRYTNYSYETDYNGYTTTVTDSQGQEKATYYNFAGQLLSTDEKTVTGGRVGTAYGYDVYGRRYKTSQPAAPGSYNQWEETEWDEYGRVKQVTSYTGKVTAYTYSGLATTVNDGTKSVTTTKNALGQVVSVQDPSGTVNYTYYAHGGLKTTNFDGVVQVLEYDGWGRKTKLTDPTAGVYQYVHNDFGEITQETTPKGVTNYTYDNNTGRLATKTVQGDDADLTYAYIYNNTTKQLTNISLLNGDGNDISYSCVYDADNRLITAVENNQHAVFTKNYTYDMFDRVITATYLAKDKVTNQSATRNISYTYQNGKVLQVTDLTSGKIINRINSLGANGQLSTALQGDNLKTTFNYDGFNFPQSVVVERTGTNAATLMSLGYSFNASRGNLTSRSNTNFGWNENFMYDDLDRLTEFNDNNSNNSQTYDYRGRITYNSVLGNYGYNGAGYQQTELNNPTSMASGWYQDRALQQISFNAFKKPVSINEEGKENVDFQYNGALQRSHMYYGSTDADKMQRPMRRHYSEDGTMEITKDMVNNTMSFVFYLGGDAYDAAAIYKEVHQGSSVNQDVYYLHRDHLGSIVLITDIDGNAIEKRQFDAWGRVVKLEDGNGNTLTAFKVTDRGYTGHEHLSNVGLINMNGRLYDPLLHRFISPDNFVQEAYNSQNLNRYAYVLNNPLLGSDPNGEFFIIDSFIIGLFKGGLKEAFKRAGNDIKIWGGLFAIDGNKGFFGNIGEFVSRLTWQLPQTLGGLGTGLAHNTLGLRGGVESVKYKYGATVIQTREAGWGGVTQGSYILGDNSIRADANNSLFQHEYGHYIQSQAMGWGYYPRVGIPSSKSEGNHTLHPVEQDANMRAFLYFNKNIKNFYAKRGDVVQGRGWDFTENILNIDGTGNAGQYVDYKDDADKLKLKSLKVSPTFLDYFSWALPLPIYSAFQQGNSNARNYNGR